MAAVSKKQKKKKDICKDLNDWLICISISERDILKSFAGIKTQGNLLSTKNDTSTKEQLRFVPVQIYSTDTICLANITPILG